MLYLEDILNWFEELNTTYKLNIEDEHIYIGARDNKKEKSLGIYNLKKGLEPKAIGGNECKTYNTLNISLLIHYTKNFRETEKFSYNIYNLLSNLSEISNLKINDYEINFLELLSENEDIGTDDKGIFERVINFRINYKKKMEA